ncbi:pseudouridine synthase [Streptococcus halichoeri]|uniref:pseudouridine synthase n=1 Tax=Streptococcus halichoeri TaxID=254785 RepID=UPI00135AC506|nr:pseudouridine synthase [Streptococcus halichoeri]
MRLDKLLELAKIGSRKQVKQLLARKQVLIDGLPAWSAAQNCDPGLQVITVKGQVIRDFAAQYFLLHKPAGVVSACWDTTYQTVIDLVDPKHVYDNLYPIGRLDRDTEGLILITNNGPLGFRMLHPKYHVSKTYFVEVNGYLGQDACEFFSQGVVFADGTKCKAALLEVIASGATLSQAQVTISEGKFHQVKKMFLAYGVKVVYLRRTAFAGFTLGQLPVGAFRTLTAEELRHLKTFLD